MKQPDQTGVTLHQLGLQTPAEHRATSALLDTSPSARTHAQAVQDVAAAVLLARAGQAVPPPPGVLMEITDRIAAGERKSLWKKRTTALLRWSGWGVAAALALSMLREQGPKQTELVAQPAFTKAEGNKYEQNIPVQAIQPPAATSAPVAEEIAGLRHEVVKLRKELESLRSPDGSRRLIAITQFRRPGEAAGSRPPEGLVSLLSSSLQPLLTSAGNSATGPEIVVERGFGAFTAASLPEGYYYRHKRFPADQWESLGLAKDENERFYDPLGGLIWQADPSQPGTYVSLHPEPGEDLSGFATAVPNSATNIPAPTTAPQQPGVIAVTDPGTGEGKLLISNPEALRPKTNGTVPVIWVGTRGANGRTQWLRVGELSLPTSTPQQTELRPATSPPQAQRFALADSGSHTPDGVIRTAGSTQNITLGTFAGNALSNAGALIGVSHESTQNLSNNTAPSTPPQIIGQH